MVIVVAGEALVDLLIRPGGAITAVPGGGMFNTARTIARLGQAVAFLGRLSDDGFGRMLWAALAADGVEGSFVEVTLAPTTLAIAELDAAGAASYRFHVAETSAPGLSGDAVRAALAVCPRALCVGSLGLVLEPMAAAVAEGVARTDPTTFVMLDPNCRPALIADRRSYLDLLDPIVRRADVVKLSRDDLAYLAPGIDAIPAARDLLGRGPAAILLTDGPGVVVGLTSTFECELPVPPIEVVDTIGAGDALGGAFLARWVERGYGRVELADEALVRDALEWAIEVAALTCRRPGADPPRRDDLP